MFMWCVDHYVAKLIGKLCWWCPGDYYVGEMFSCGSYADAHVVLITMSEVCFITGRFMLIAHVVLMSCGDQCRSSCASQTTSLAATSWEEKQSYLMRSPFQIQFDVHTFSSVPKSSFHWTNFAFLVQFEIYSSFCNFLEGLVFLLTQSFRNV